MALKLKIGQVRRLVRVHHESLKKESQEWDDLIKWYNGENIGDPERKMYLNLGFMLADSVGAAMSLRNPRFHLHAKRADLDDKARAGSKVLDQDAQANHLSDRINEMVRKAVLYPRAFAKVVWHSKLRRPHVIALDPRQVWWDKGYKFEEAPYIGATFAFRKDEIEDMVEKGWNPKGVPDHPAEKTRPWWMKSKDKQTDETLADILKLRLVHEIIFPGENRCVHYMTGAEKFLYDGPLPYERVANPYVKLSFHSNLKDEGGLSDCQLVKVLQGAINELDETLIDHAKRSVPITLMDQEALGEDAIEAIVDARVGELVGVQGSNMGGRPLSAALAAAPMPTMSPDFYQARRQMHETAMWVVGLPDWMRGQATKNLETATQAAQTEQGMRNRFTYRLGLVNECMRQIGQRMWELRLEHMDPYERVALTPQDQKALPPHATLKDLEAAREIELIAHDPMNASPEADIQKLSNILAQLGPTGALDIAAVAKKMMLLAGLDPSLVQDPQQFAQAQALLQQQQAANDPAAQGTAG